MTRRQPRHIYVSIPSSQGKATSRRRWIALASSAKTSRSRPAGSRSSTSENRSVRTDAASCICLQNQAAPSRVKHNFSAYGGGGRPGPPPNREMRLAGPMRKRPFTHPSNFSACTGPHEAREAAASFGSGADRLGLTARAKPGGRAFLASANPSSPAYNVDQSVDQLLRAAEITSDLSQLRQGIGGGDEIRTHGRG